MQLGTERESVLRGPQAESWSLRAGSETQGGVSPLHAQTNDGCFSVKWASIDNRFTYDSELEKKSTENRAVNKSKKKKICLLFGAHMLVGEDGQ